MWGIILAIISGILMGVQGVFNTQVTKASGVWAASSFVQASALVVCLFIWYYFEGGSLLNVIRVSPKYMLLGGVFGAFITITVIKSMDALGPAKAVLLIVIAQLLCAYLIEVFGLFLVEKQALEVRKIIGIVVAIIGFILFQWK